MRKDDSLSALAEEALREMILDRRLSAGDLIKLLGAQTGDREGHEMSDFVIRLSREDT